MFWRRRDPRSEPAHEDLPVSPPDRELDVLLADLAHRQEEIVDRGRSEHQQFVLFVTIVGAALAALAVIVGEFITLPTELLPLTPTLVAVIALGLSFFPLNVAHIAYATEVRRVYVRDELLPRIRALVDANPPLPDFEAFDRDKQRWLPNMVTTARSAILWLPPIALFVLYLRLPYDQVGAVAGPLVRDGVAHWIEWFCWAVVAVIVVLSGINLVLMRWLIGRTRRAAVVAG